MAFVEAIAQAERSDELREQMAVHYRDGRHGLAEALAGNLGALTAAGTYLVGRSFDAVVG